MIMFAQNAVNSAYNYNAIIVVITRSSDEVTTRHSSRLVVSIPLFPRTLYGLFDGD